MRAGWDSSTRTESSTATARCRWTSWTPTCSKAHGLLIGQSLPETAEQDFEAHPPSPWGSPGETPDKQEGHDTWYIAGHADGSGEMVTWGGLQPFTPEYRTGRFITDAWLIFDRDDPEVDWQALEAALAEVHGTVVPPATPTPAPT